MPAPGTHLAALVRLVTGASHEVSTFEAERRGGEEAGVKMMDPGGGRGLGRPEECPAHSWPARGTRMTPGWRYFFWGVDIKQRYNIQYNIYNICTHIFI